MKNLKKLGKALNKVEQKEINGGGRILIGGQPSNCFAITDENTCQRTKGCNYYACYCGPTYPHIAPCS